MMPTIRLGRVVINTYRRVSPLTGHRYLEFLERLHLKHSVSRYVEIGTLRGATLKFATGAAVAIDPDFQLDKASWATKPGLKLFECTSDAFFANKNLRDELGGRADLAFIDGMHLSEFALRDFINLERYCKPSGLIVLHDAVPKNFEMTERDRQPTMRKDTALAGAWTGDVWRIIPLLRRERPDLRIQILDCPPTGLVLVSNLDPQSRLLSERAQALQIGLTDTPTQEADFWTYIESLHLYDSRRYMEEL